jgi:hypothetical protein
MHFCVLASDQPVHSAQAISKIKPPLKSRRRQSRHSQVGSSAAQLDASIHGPKTTSQNVRLISAAKRFFCHVSWWCGTLYARTHTATPAPAAEVSCCLRAVATLPFVSLTAGRGQFTLPATRRQLPRGPHGRIGCNALAGSLSVINPLAFPVRGLG